MTDSRLSSTWWALRLVYGVVPIVAGLDKFTNLLTDWTQYLSPFVRGLLPVSPSAFMHVVGVVEIAAGALVLSRLTRAGAFVVSAWLVCIALSLVAGGHFLDVAARDLSLAVGAYALARLTELRSEAGAGEPARPQPRGAVPSRA